MDGGGYTGWRDTVVGTLDRGLLVQWWVHWMEGYMYSGGYTGLVVSSNQHVFLITS